MLCLLSLPLLGGCSLAPFGHKHGKTPHVQAQPARPADEGLKIAVDIIMAQLRKADDTGDLRAVEGAAPQIYQLAAALMPPAQPGAAAPHPHAGQQQHPAAMPAEAPAPARKAEMNAVSYTPEHAAPPPPPPPLPQARSLLYAVHLGSYRSPGRAMRGFAELARKAPDLAGLRARVEQVDLGPGKGVFERLKAGPLTSRAAAEALCGKLHTAGLYCSPADFTGRAPS